MASPPSVSCYSTLMNTNEKVVFLLHLLLTPLPAQPKQRPAVGLIISSNGWDSGPVCANKHSNGAGRRGWRTVQPAHEWMRFQQTSASIGPVWTANYCWPMLYYFTTKDCCQEKGGRGRGGGGGGGERTQKSWKGAWGEERFSECHNNL